MENYFVNRSSVTPCNINWIIHYEPLGTQNLLNLHKRSARQGFFYLLITHKFECGGPCEVNGFFNINGYNSMQRFYTLTSNIFTSLSSVSPMGLSIFVTAMFSFSARVLPTFKIATGTLFSTALLASLKAE